VPSKPSKPVAHRSSARTAEVIGNWQLTAGQVPSSTVPGGPSEPREVRPHRYSPLELPRPRSEPGYLPPTGGFRASR
jgi:hypothetical protein